MNLILFLLCLFALDSKADVTGIWNVFDTECVVNYRTVPCEAMPKSIEIKNSPATALEIIFNYQGKAETLLLNQQGEEKTPAENAYWVRVEVLKNEIRCEEISIKDQKINARWVFGSPYQENKYYLQVLIDNQFPVWSHKKIAYYLSR